MNTRTLRDLIVTGAVALASLACISAPPLDTRTELSASQAPVVRQAPQHQEASRPKQTPVLYARDGTPVSAVGPTTVQETAGPLAGRELAGNQGGRMYILELYQNVIEERDTLSIEVAALSAELERARQALTSADLRIDELEGNLRTAGDENQRLREENIDLAGRLTTAQIRRLQTEKILLELRLAEIDAAAVADEAQQP